MTVLLSLLPILLLVFFIAIFIAVSIGMKIAKNFWTVKKIYIAIIGYIVFGLFAFLYLSITASDKKELLSKDEMNQLVQEENRFWEMINQNQLDELNNDYLIEEQTYELPTNKLTIRSSSGQYVGVIVVVNLRDDPTSNEVYAKKYRLPYAYRGIDITESIEEYKIELLEDNLIINDRKEESYSFYGMKSNSELLEGQFGNGIMKESESSVTGLTILYLNVPNHVNIIDEGDLIIYPSTY